MTGVARTTIWLPTPSSYHLRCHNKTPTVAKSTGNMADPRKSWQGRLLSYLWCLTRNFPLFHRKWELIKSIKGFHMEWPTSIWEKNQASFARSLNWPSFDFLLWNGFTSFSLFCILIIVKLAFHESSNEHQICETVHWSWGNKLHSI